MALIDSLSKPRDKYKTQPKTRKVT